MNNKITIVIPCYQSEGNLIPLLSDIERVVLSASDYTFDLLFIDDGSTDNTYNELKQILNTTTIQSSIIKLTRNFGSYNALSAGIHFAKGDAIIHLHSDGEDPPSLIPEMIGYWEKGTKFIIAHRTERDDVKMQKPLSDFYHYLMNKLMVRKMPAGGFDLILFDRQIADDIKKINEKNINLVYLIAWLGYPYISIPYKRSKRQMGNSQWTTPRKIKLVIDSIVGFTFIPLRLILYTGILLTLLGIIFKTLSFFKHADTSNYDLESLILFCSGIIVTALGIIGEYLWRVLEQSKTRPTFVVDEIETNRNS